MKPSSVEPVKQWPRGSSGLYPSQDKAKPGKDREGNTWPGKGKFRESQCQGNTKPGKGKVKERQNQVKAKLRKDKVRERQSHGKAKPVLSLSGVETK